MRSPWLLSSTIAAVYTQQSLRTSVKNMRSAGSNEVIQLAPLPVAAVPHRIGDPCSEKKLARLLLLLHWKP